MDKGLRAYFYTPGDAGIEMFPSGELRPTGISTTSDPWQADIFILPAIMHNFARVQLTNLPYFRGNETRHVFWDVADDMKLWLDAPSLCIRCDATRMILEHDPNTIGWAWPVENFYHPFERFDHDVVFQGWASTDLTNIVVDSVKTSGLKAHLQVHNFFFGYHYYEPEYQYLKESFRQTLWTSRLSLVPRSIPGVVRYRFYEAMSAGRVPVHFCDDRVLPWLNKIDYDRCSIHIPERDAPQTGEILEEWLSTHSDKEIVAMGEYGHEMWDRWLNRDKWNDLFGEAIREHYGAESQSSGH